jgi:hypothetical protein
MTHVRINADEFFKGNEDCIRKKTAYFDTFCNLIPSDSEYAPILKEAQRQIDEKVAAGNCWKYVFPDYSKMTEWVRSHYPEVSYSGGSIEGNTMVDLWATKRIKASPWMFIYKGISYFAYVAEGLICRISIQDGRIRNREVSLTDGTTLESIHEDSVACVKSMKADEIREFRKSLWELRSRHKYVMDRLNGVLEGKEEEKENDRL